MDDAQRERFKQVINELCASTPITLIYVSHYADEIPELVDQIIALEEGKRIS
jgi:molybdate transport system ATP-binding protein